MLTWWRSRPGMVVALAVVAVGAVLALATAGHPRWSLPGTFGDTSSAPTAVALALVALAGVGLLLLVGGVLRAAIGVVLTAVGGGVVAADLMASRAAGWFAYAPLADNVPMVAHRSMWFWLTGVGGVLVVAGGLLVAVFGAAWPGPRRTYAAAPPVGPSAPGGSPGAEAITPSDPWTALDRGGDPTV